MLKEFREFIMKGNVIDLAVAVIIGAAFGAIINSLVNDILMPIIGAILTGIDFSSLAITVGAANIAYGKFINAVVLFLIVAFILFLIVRSFNKMRKPAPPPPPPGPSAEEKLLTEIRDLLKNRQ